MFKVRRKRKKSYKKRRKEKFGNDCSDYTQFMNEQWCEKKQNQKVSHPLFFITEKEFRELSSNTIIVKNIKITLASRNNRNVSYDIESWGSNLKLEKRRWKSVKFAVK